MKKSLTVLAREQGTRLTAFLTARGIDPALIARGGVHVGGKRAKEGSRRLNAGEKVLVYETELARAPELRIVHEDADLIVVDKPAGVPVQATRQAAANSLEARLSARALHRLDLEASGLVALAKRDVKLRIVDLARRYLALASGRVQGEGRWTSPVAGKPAATRYRVMERFATATLLECELETGRTHQIRVHAAAAHHALVGDERHGGPSAARLLLHAHELGDWRSSAPTDFDAIVRSFRA